MNQQLPKLLFITHQTEVYSYLDSVRLAIAGGCKFIQLRMKGALVKDVIAVALEAKKLCQEAYATLMIDDHVEVCKELGLDGVHLGKLDMNPRKAREILGPNAWIGGTANTFDDIQELHKAGVDYVGLGPYQFTDTKKNLSPVLGVLGYQKILTSCKQAGIQLPVYAIGGIQKEDIPALMQMGIWGISLSSTILRSQDPIQETRNINYCIETSYEKINNSK